MPCLSRNRIPRFYVGNIVPFRYDTTPSVDLLYVHWWCLWEHNGHFGPRGAILCSYENNERYRRWHWSRHPRIQTSRWHCPSMPYIPPRNYKSHMMTFLCACHWERTVTSAQSRGRVWSVRGGKEWVLGALPLIYKKNLLVSLYDWFDAHQRHHPSCRIWFFRKRGDLMPF